MKALQVLGRRFSNVSEKAMPDPLIFAVGLTFVAFILGITLAGNTPMKMLNNWYTGFWELLAFAMQMTLILVTGHALARAPMISKYIHRFASVPKNTAQAAWMTALVACVFSWLNWGLGLIVGALFALEVGKQLHRNGIKIHYPVVVAAGYTGQMVWHIGPSTSAGLLSATKGHFLEGIIGIVPIAETAFSGYALMMSVMLVLIVVPGIMYFIAPKQEAKGIDVYAPQLLVEGEAAAAAAPVKVVMADRLDNSRLISILVALMGLIVIVHYFYTKGADLNLNIFNFIFLTLGILLHGTPARYIQAVKEATIGASGIILQFPFYAGIMGMIKYSGLATIMAGWLLTFSTPTNFPVITWLTGGFMNIFVPSGGGEWAVIGEIISRASLELGVPIGKTIIAYGCGDMWTNMLQPFWALALLGITGLRARDIIGYTVLLMLLAAPFIGLGLYFFPY